LPINQTQPIMAKGDQYIFIFLHIIAWIIFVGLSIEAGGLIVNFFFSLYNPELIPNLYQKLDLTEMYNRSTWAFFSMYSFILVISILKACLFYILIMLLSKMDLSKPFSPFVSGHITKISYYTFSVGILSFGARQTANTLLHKGYNISSLNQFWADSQAYIIMAAVVYVIAAIFKKGVDLQNENDLTV